MKHLRYAYLLALAMIALDAFAQDCVDYHELGDCVLDRQKGYKIYSQSKSVYINPLDTVELNIVFYGQNDYILSFCTYKKMYPIHFTLVDPESRLVIYDNTNDRFIESLGLGFDVTKSITVTIQALAGSSTEEEIEHSVGCVGLLIQYKNYDVRKVNLRMQ